MQSSPDSTCTGSRLMSLPLEILAQIVDALDATTPLFVPIYGQENETLCNYGHLDTQHIKYYGPNRDTENKLASQAVLNWSSTCSHSRSLLAPHLFRDVVLRTEPKSIESVGTLSKTSHWSQIKGLTVCTTFLLDEERDEGITNPFRDLDLGRLQSILSDLPPNLRSLTVDFPWDWTDEVTDDFAIPNEGEFADVFYAIFHALGLNDISGKGYFTLNLLNLPGGRFYTSDGRDAIQEDGFRNFLSHATTFEMSLPHVDNGAGWQMSVYRSGSNNFSSALGTQFLDCLTDTTTLTIAANESCPIGVNLGYNELAFPMPAADREFPNLKNLTLDHFFLDHNLILFTTWHAPNIEHLKLLNCGATPPGVSHRNEDAYSWASFFTALTKHAKSLKTLSLKHLEDEESLLDFYEYRNNPENSSMQTSNEIKAAFAQLEALKAGSEELDEDDRRRRKRVLPYMDLDDKYGFLGVDEDGSAERFLDGSDHKALLELWKALEERGGEGVLYL